MKHDVRAFMDKLSAAEAGCDAALTRYTELMAAALAVEGLKFGESQAVYADINEAMQMLLRGRHHLARAHAKSLEIGQRNAMMPTAWGDTMETYNEARDVPSATIEPLRIAA